LAPPPLPRDLEGEALRDSFQNLPEQQRDQRELERERRKEQLMERLRQKREQREREQFERDYMQER
jgi:hypothetical protein